MIRNVKHFSLVIVLIATAALQACSQIPDFSKVPNVQKNDSAAITDLVHHGIQITKPKVVCWFPSDSFPRKRMNEIADTINMGVAAAEKFLNAPLPWQVHPFNEPYIFYFRADSFVSHASLAGFVSVPSWRIKNGKAPWLHEALHEMLNTKSGSWEDTVKVSEEDWKTKMPLWLFEGLPDYIALEVSRTNNLSWFDVFSKSSQMNTDSIFKEDMNEKNEHASYILSHIGENGVIPELFSKDRIKYAPAFYHGSCSFVAYIARMYGIEPLLSAVSSFQKEQETLETMTGKPLDVLKKEWLEKLKIVR
jgi:hypothetical protein